jgi:citrate lyase subunit beta / citryl-CoA lyase
MTKMLHLRPMRSVLYVPAANPKAIEKSRSLDCDAVIIDLEDAVAPGEKETARSRAVETVRNRGFGDRLVAVRVNGIDTPWGREDIEALSEVTPDAVLAPKIATADDVRRYDGLLSSMPATTRLWIMIETARSVFCLPEIADAAANTRLTAFVVGTNDLCKDINARLVAGRAALMPQLSLAVTAARMAGLAIFDGVYNNLQDDAGFDAECRQGLEIGFDGKTLIHPSQIAIANRAFSPAPDEIGFATAVIEAFTKPENLNLGALRVDGRMVERLHLQQCQRLVRIAEIIARTTTAPSRD